MVSQRFIPIKQHLNLKTALLTGSIGASLLPCHLLAGREKPPEANYC